MKKKSLGVFLGGVAVLAAILICTGAIRETPSRKGEPLVLEQLQQQTLPEITELPPSSAPETQPEIRELQQTQPAQTQTVETQPQAATIDTVPQYFRNDYPDDRYGTGTIANSGSGMTALAMVASYLTNHAYYPDEVADYLADFCGNTVERMEYGSDLLGLSWRRAANFYEAKQELQAGKVAIVLLNGNFRFSNGSHYIVWTGISPEGLILVNDPEKSNYDRWDLKEGFASGFPDKLLIGGCSAAWVYDKSAMPESVPRYEPEPYAEQCRYEELELTDQELTQMARLICAEGASESFEGQQAIAEVILNRLVTEGFPKTVHGVIHAQGQFLGAQYMDRQSPTYTQYKAIDRALNGPYVLPKEVVFFSTGPVNDNVWGRIGQHTFCYSYQYQGE